MRFTMILAEIRSGFPGFSGFYSEGVASLAALLKAQDHSFTLLHITRPASPGAIAIRAAATAPDIIGYSCMTHTFPYVRDYAEAVRKVLPHVPAIIGGVHARLHPEECLASSGIDAVCTGEGEIPLPIFVDRIEHNLPTRDIPGIWTKEGDTILRNQPSPVVTDLDSLPLPDMSIFPSSRLMTTRERVIYAHASRGCPFHCSFCCNDALRQSLPASTPTVRLKSVGRVCKEIAASAGVGRKKLIGIYFQDDCFPLSKEWLEEFAVVYPAEIGVPFNCNLRADCVTDERARLLRLSGCVSVSIGVETGVEEVRTSGLRKDITRDQFKRSFSILEEHGIHINTFSMVGLPDETCDAALETVRFNSHPAVDRAMCSIFFPYYGTELYERCVERGMLTGEMRDTYQQTTVLRQRSIDRSQVEFIHDFFGPLTAVFRRFGEHSVVSRMMCGWIRKGNTSLTAVTLVYRFIRSVMIVLYLTAGKYVVNRQKRIFA